MIIEDDEKNYYDLSNSRAMAYIMNVAAESKMKILLLYLNYNNWILE